MICKPYSQSVVQDYDKMHGNIVLSTEKLWFANPTVSQLFNIMIKGIETLCCRHDKMHGNTEPSSSFCILTHSHPAKTTLTHDAVDEIIAFSTFLMGQNQPETRNSRQNQHLFITFAAAQNKPETRCCPQNHSFPKICCRSYSRLW